VTPRLTLLDYGMCNMLNVARAFEHVGAELTITEDPVEAARADRLVVPGVGAFADSMAEVHRRGHADAIRRFVETGRPILGICVGMQILFEGSEEFSASEGLGILKGWVRAIPRTTPEGERLRVPHIGWNHLASPRETNRSWAGTILEPFDQQSPAVYFVHSFTADPTDPSIRLADCDYAGRRICAAVKRDNLTATQFHPERSGEVGLRLLQQFVAS
jgi:glutamine amidotransferase